MRVFGILAILLLVAAGALYFFVRTDSTEKVVMSGKPVEPTQEAGNAISETKKSLTPTMGPETATPVAPQKTDDADPSENKTVTKPVIVEKKSADTGIAAMVTPRFDVVRVDENCGLLAAGTAEPMSRISVLAGEKLIGRATTSRRGEWIFVSTEPLAPGAQEINVKAVNPDGREMETPRLVIMQVPDCNVVETERAPAIALLAPKAEDKQDAFKERITKLLQMPEPQGDLSAAKNLSVGSIDYDNEGNVALSGKGTPGNTIQLYLENAPIGSTAVGPNGDWALVPENDIPSGTYVLRADQIDPNGKVVSRVEIPFQRAPADDVILAKGGLEIRAVVQPGNSLWRIARRMYGEGTHYTTIYQANQEQIKDPDLIFPGQIFKLPSE